MATDLLRDNPELRPFILSNVTLTGTRIGAGAYGSVDEVAISVRGAAKKIHDIFQDRSEIPQDEIRRASTQFVKECQLMSTLRHPNIVQFLGVCFFEGSQLPALIMERLLTSLHDLLAPETQPPPGTPAPLSFFNLGLKCSVLHNVASGLDYLHHQTPPIIHRDLSARNILLNSKLVGKLADLGVARIVPRMRDAATMTKAPGASIYMPPEATAPAESNDEKSKYDTGIDIFSFGIVTIFTVGETFPCDPLAHNYFDEENGIVIARTELQRRSRYMQNVNTQLRAYGQLRGDHPLIRLIQQCLHNSARKRPNISEVRGLLEEAGAGIRDEESERNRVELVRALQNQPRNQNLVQLIDDLVTKNAALQQQLTRAEKTTIREGHQLRQLGVAELQQQLQSSEREKELFRQQLARKEAELMESIRREQQHQMRQQEVAELQQQLQSREREKEMFRQQLRRKEAELTRAEETIRREQQQRSQLEIEKDRELAQAQQQLRQQEQSSRKEIGNLKLQLQSTEDLVADFQKTLQQKDSELDTLRTKTQSPVLPPPYTRELHTSSTSQSTQQSSPKAAGPAVPHSILPFKQGKLTVQCHKKKPAPCKMERGSATTDDQFVYITTDYSNTIYRYEWSTEKWDELPRSPHYNSGLVVIDGELTTVGGNTNKLLTLRQDRWVEHYPPMITKRSFPAVVITSDGNYVLVIGGNDGVFIVDHWTAKVELFHVWSRRWCKLTNLPRNLTRPLPTICGNQLYVTGCNGGCYSSSLELLPFSDLSIAITNIEWTQLPRQPVKYATAASLHGQLVIVGGETSHIHQLVDGQWVKIGSTLSERSMSFVASQSHKMMIVGGWKQDSVEECVVV